MTHLLTLYLGNSEICREARDNLQRWCESREDVVLAVESIHADPAAALRLHITQLPALVLGGAVLAQGPPEAWLNRSFYERLTEVIHSADTLGE